MLTDAGPDACAAIEAFLASAAKPGSHGQGRDSHGIPFRRFKVKKVEFIRNQMVWARYTMERDLLVKELASEQYTLSSEVECLVPPATKLPLPGMPRLQVGERLLFHGSGECEAIYKTGFEVKRSFSGAAAYGRGIYFATSPSKADQYAKGDPPQLLLCRAFLGRCDLVSGLRFKEPLLPLVRGRQDGLRLNAIVARGNFTEIVLGQNNIVYPELLVTYEREGK